MKDKTTIIQVVKYIEECNDQKNLEKIHSFVVNRLNVCLDTDIIKVFIDNLDLNTEEDFAKFSTLQKCISTKDQAFKLKMQTDVKTCKDKGMKVDDIAKELNIPIDKVKRTLKDIEDKIRAEEWAQRIKKAKELHANGKTLEEISKALDKPVAKIEEYLKNKFVK